MPNPNSKARYSSELGPIVYVNVGSGTIQGVLYIPLGEPLAKLYAHKTPRILEAYPDMRMRYDGW